MHTHLHMLINLHVCIQVTADVNRFQAMYKDTAQYFLADPIVMAYLADAAAALNPAITPAVIRSMLDLVQVCACHLNFQSPGTPYTYTYT